MKQIPLSGGKGAGLYAAVSDRDFPVLSCFKWHLGTHGYPIMTLSNGKHFGMHKMIGTPNPGEAWDHIDRNKLNNTRENLRSATQQQNIWNQASRSKFGVRGVMKNTKGYQARITVGNKTFCLGTYETVREAHEAYRKMATKLRGHAFNELAKEHESK